jgi:mannose-6-phosphate isomerase-like protein (cupin superfamily)
MKKTKDSNDSLNHLFYREYEDQFSYNSFTTETDSGNSTSLYINKKLNYAVRKVSIDKDKHLHVPSSGNHRIFWLIVSGSGKFRIGNNFFTASDGIQIYIPHNTLYDVKNIGEKSMEIVETVMDIHGDT